MSMADPETTLKAKVTELKVARPVTADPKLQDQSGICNGRRVQLPSTTIVKHKFDMHSTSMRRVEHAQS